MKKQLRDLGWPRKRRSLKTDYWTELLLNVRLEGCVRKRNKTLNAFVFSLLSFFFFLFVNTCTKLYVSFIKKNFMIISTREECILLWSYSIYLRTFDLDAFFIASSLNGASLRPQPVDGTTESLLSVHSYPWRPFSCMLFVVVVITTVRQFAMLLVHKILTEN